MVITDSSRWSATSQPAAAAAAWGDTLVLLGAAMYSVCNVAEEALLGASVHALVDRIPSLYALWPMLCRGIGNTLA